MSIEATNGTSGAQLITSLHIISKCKKKEKKRKEEDEIQMYYLLYEFNRYSVC